MTLEETGKVMDLLGVFYPAFYAKQSANDKLLAAQMWAAIFSDDEVSIVLAATKAFVVADTKGFPPVPGQIKAKISQITQPVGMTEMEAWNYVSKAIANSTYNAKQEFEALPDTIKRIVGSPQRLREWGALDPDQVQTVIQSNFMRSYRSRAQTEREYNMLPGDVKAIMGQLAEVKAMPELMEDNNA